MLTFEQMKELIELVSSRQLDGLELERSGFRFKVDGRRASVAAPPLAVGPQEPASATAAAPAIPSPVAVAAAPAVTPEAAAPTPPKIDAHELTSPIVGTFYRAPNPEAPSFVEVGDRVKKGQVLCIIEAMKLMNEIESDVDGQVVEIFPQNAQPVEFGEPLFAIKT